MCHSKNHTPYPTRTPPCLKYCPLIDGCMLPGRAHTATKEGLVTPLLSPHLMKPLTALWTSDWWLHPPGRARRRAVWAWSGWNPPFWKLLLFLQLHSSIRRESYCRSKGWCLDQLCSFLIFFCWQYSTCPYKYLSVRCPVYEIFSIFNFLGQHSRRTYRMGDLTLLCGTLRVLLENFHFTPCAISGYKMNCICINIKL